jgi:hypothetical protein
MIVVVLLLAAAQVVRTRNIHDAPGGAGVVACPAPPLPGGTGDVGTPISR